MSACNRNFIVCGCEKEKVVLKEVVGSSIELSSPVEPAYEAPRWAIESAFLLYGILVLELLEVMEEPGEDSVHCVQAAICDPRYSSS